MKTVFALALVSTLLSLLALLALSAMTLVPTPGAEAFRASAMLVITVFFAIWASIAVWARPGCGTRRVAMPRWLSRSLVAVMSVYSLALVGCVIG